MRCSTANCPRSMNSPKAVALLALTLLSVGASACASSSGPPRSKLATVDGETTAPGHIEDYADGDNDAKHKDDTYILGYGHPANVADGHAIVVLFKRYYAAAAARDGTAACALFYTPFVARLDGGYEQPLDRPPPRGESCATIASKLFDRRRYLLAIEQAKLKAIGARVSGETGYALLRFETITPETFYMPLHIQSGRWKIDGLFIRSLL